MRPSDPSAVTCMYWLQTQHIPCAAPTTRRLPGSIPPPSTACLSSAGMQTPLTERDMKETAFDYHVVIGPRSRACQHARAWGVFEPTAEYHTVQVILYDVSVPGATILGSARFRGCPWRDSKMARALERCRRLAWLRVRCQRRRSVLPAYFTYSSWKIKVRRHGKKERAARAIAPCCFSGTPRTGLSCTITGQHSRHPPRSVCTEHEFPKNRRGPMTLPSASLQEPSST